MKKVSHYLSLTVLFCLSSAAYCQENQHPTNKSEILSGNKKIQKSAFEYVSFELTTTDRKTLDRFRVETVRNENKVFSIEYSSDFKFVTIQYIATLGEDNLKSILLNKGISIKETEVELINQQR